MIAPKSMDALAEVARTLGFDLRRSEHAVPAGVDFDRAKEQTQFALFCGDLPAFDGTARECSAFLIGWRTLRSRLLGELRATDEPPWPGVSARTMCEVRDKHGNRCLLHAGHDGLKHARLAHWEDDR